MRMNLLVSCCVLALAGVASAQTTATAKAAVEEDKKAIVAVVKKLFDSLGARFASRPGGYTRILRLGPRPGDGAEMAIVELIGSEYQPEKKKAEKDKKKEAAAPAKAKSGKAPREAKAKAKEPAKPRDKRRKSKESEAE